MEETAAALTDNILTFSTTLNQLFSNMFWHLQCCKYVAVTYINTKTEWEVKVIKTKLCLIGKNTYLNHMLWLSHVAQLSKHWTSLLVSFEDSESQPIIWLSV